MERAFKATFIIIVSTILVLIGVFLIVEIKKIANNTNVEKEKVIGIVESYDITTSPNSTYMSIASSYLAQGNYSLYSVYTVLADESPDYTYHTIFAVASHSEKIELKLTVEPKIGDEYELTLIKTYMDNKLISSHFTL